MCNKIVYFSRTFRVVLLPLRTKWISRRSVRSWRLTLVGEHLREDLVVALSPKTRQLFGRRVVRSVRSRLSALGQIQIDGLRAQQLDFLRCRATGAECTASPLLSARQCFPRAETSQITNPTSVAHLDLRQRQTQWRHQGAPPRTGCGPCTVIVLSVDP